MRVQDRPKDGWVEARARLEAGRRQRPAPRGLEAAVHQAIKEEATWEESERKGRESRRQKRRDDRGDRGAAGSSYPGQAGEGARCPIGGNGSAPAAHRQRFCHINIARPVDETETECFGMIVS
jgi:hypothetical protein